MTTEAQDRARRNHELRALKAGAKRMPGGIMPAEAAEALDTIYSARYITYMAAHNAMQTGD